jgi:hypothetical protein
MPISKISIEPDTLEFERALLASTPRRAALLSEHIWTREVTARVDSADEQGSLPGGEDQEHLGKQGGVQSEDDCSAALLRPSKRWNPRCL